MDLNCSQICEQDFSPSNFGGKLTVVHSADHQYKIDLIYRAHLLNSSIMGLGLYLASTCE